MFIYIYIYIYICLSLSLPIYISIYVSIYLLLFHFSNILFSLTMQTIVARLNNIFHTNVPSNVELISVPKSPHVLKAYLDFP